MTNPQIPLCPHNLRPDDCGYCHDGGAAVVKESMTADGPARCLHGTPLILGNNCVRCATAKREAEAPGPPAIVDRFMGDNDRLRDCIRALLEMDASGSLVPHGIGGHARSLLSACYGRLDELAVAIEQLKASARFPEPPATPQAALTVWYGQMPETNGKSNFTAILMRKGGDIVDGITIDQSEYPDRVRYEADRVRYLIGELKERPDILAYDADKHSGYVAPSQSAQKPEQTEAMVPELEEWIARNGFIAEIADTSPTETDNAVLISDLRALFSGHRLAPVVSKAEVEKVLTGLHEIRKTSALEDEYNTAIAAIALITKLAGLDGGKTK